MVIVELKFSIPTEESAVIEAHISDDENANIPERIAAEAAVRIYNSIFVSIIQSMGGRDIVIESDEEDVKEQTTSTSKVVCSEISPIPPVSTDAENDSEMN